MSLFKWSKAAEYREINRLKQEMLQLQKAFLIENTIDEQFPIATWAKTIDGVIISMNGVCYKTFIKPSGNTFKKAIGSTDYDLFVKESADIITKHDKYVLNLGEPVQFIEVLEVNGQVDEWIVIRIPVLNDQEKPILLKGMAYKSIRFYDETA